MDNSHPKHDILSIAACLAALASTAIHAGYFAVTQKLPVYASDECINFSMYRSHWCATSSAIALAGLGVAFLAAASFTKPRAFLCWRNLTTLLFLVPAAYTGTCIARLFL